MSIIYFERVCSLKYRVCDVHPPYCHPLPAPLFGIFPHYLINGTVLEREKSYLTKNLYLISLQLLSETFLILRKTKRDMINIYTVFKIFILDSNSLTNTKN